MTGCDLQSVFVCVCVCVCALYLDRLGHRGGGFGSDPVRVGPPWKRSLGYCEMSWAYILFDYAFLSGIVFGSLSGSFCVAITICSHVCSKRRTQPLGVSVICPARCVVVAPLGAVPVVGGSLDPSVPRSPGVTFQEKAGRPVGPSTLQ